MYRGHSIRLGPFASRLAAGLVGARKAWALTAVFAFWCHGADAQPRIDLVTEVFPPFSFHAGDGKGSGFSYELVESICRITGDCNPIAILPWSRAVKMATDKPNTALFSMYRKPEREGKFRWVGPLAHANVVFLARKDRGLKIASLEDAKKLPKIGVQANSTHHMVLAANGFANLELTSANDEISGNTNLSKLLAGRFDAWIATEQSARAKAKLLGIPNDRLETVYVISRDALYIAFNLGTSQTTVSKWQNALDAMKARPEFQQLCAKYGIE